MFVWLLLFGTVLPYLVAQNSEVKSVGKCLKQYFDEVQELGLEQPYLQAIKDRFTNDLSEPRPTQRTPRVIVTLGLGNIRYSDVFRHLYQLNISGIDRRSKTSFNCQYGEPLSLNGFKSQLMNENVQYVQASGKVLQLPITTDWLTLVNTNPRTLIIMHDVADEEYYDGINAGPCITNRRDVNMPDYCQIPFLPIGPPHTRHPVNVLSYNYRLRSFTKNQAFALFAAYRKLIACTVPPEQFLRVTLNGTLQTVDYWSKLVNFLNISTTPAQVKYLSQGGTICEDPAEYLPTTLANKFDKCATEYADTMASVFGQEFHSLILNRMLEQPVAPRRAPMNTNRIMINIGPGTTGTRTVHLAVSILNITSRHYTASNNLPSGTVYSDIDSDMKIFTIDKTERPVFWSDTPVSEKWWHLIKQYPRTRVMITDVRDDENWRIKRIKEHCNHTELREPWDDCTTPFAIGFYHFSEQTLAFNRKVFLKFVNASAHHTSYQAFRRLLRCAVPEEQLMFMYVTEETSSFAFWHKLVKFTNITVPSDALDSLITAGLPRCGSKGCFIGNKNISSNFF